PVAGLPLVKSAVQVRAALSGPRRVGRQTGTGGKKALMARTGANKSLDKPAPKARGTGEAAAPTPAKTAAKATAKTVRKKPDPAGVAAKPVAKPPAKAAGKTTRAAAKPAAKAVKPTKTAKPSTPAGKAVKSAPAKAVNVKAKAAPAAKRVPTRKNDSEVGQVAEAKGKRAATATKAPAKPAAPVPAPADGGFPAKTLDKLRRLLEEERETYLRQAHDLAAEAEALASEREPGDTQFDEESGE